MVKADDAKALGCKQAASALAGPQERMADDAVSFMQAMAAVTGTAPSTSHTKDRLDGCAVQQAGKQPRPRSHWLATNGRLRLHTGLSRLPAACAMLTCSSSLARWRRPAALHPRALSAWPPSPIPAGHVLYCLALAAIDLRENPQGAQRLQLQQLLDEPAILQMLASSSVISSGSSLYTESEYKRPLVWALAHVVLQGAHTSDRLMESAARCFKSPSAKPTPGRMAVVSSAQALVAAIFDKLTTANKPWAGRIFWEGARAGLMSCAQGLACLHPPPAARHHLLRPL